MTTIPLTTIFTPPASCASSWTYESSYYNSVPGGLLIQNDLPTSVDTACFPPGFKGAGRLIEQIQIYSPGACPVGYTIGAQTFIGGTTTAICCLSGFSYTSTLSTVNHALISQLFDFVGCTSIYPSSDGVTTVLARIDYSEFTTMTVSGPITMWGQPITVAFQQKDLSFFTTPTTTTSSTPSKTGGGTAHTSGLPKSAGSTLSPGSKAAIILGVMVFMIIFLAAGFIFIVKRRRKARALQDKEGSSQSARLAEMWEDPLQQRELDGNEIRRDSDRSYYLANTRSPRASGKTDDPTQLLEME